MCQNESIVYIQTSCLPKNTSRSLELCLIYKLKPFPIIFCCFVCAKCTFEIVEVERVQSKERPNFQRLASATGGQLSDDFTILPHLAAPARRQQNLLPITRLVAVVSLFFLDTND